MGTRKPISALLLWCWKIDVFVVIKVFFHVYFLFTWQFWTISGSNWEEYMTNGRDSNVIASKVPVI